MKKYAITMVLNEFIQVGHSPCFLYLVFTFEYVSKRILCLSLFYHSELMIYYLYGKSFLYILWNKFYKKVLLGML
jgi:hypothetical protein